MSRPLTLRTALQKYGDREKRCPECASDADLEELWEQLREATSIGMATIFAHVGVYSALPPYMKEKYDRLNELHRGAGAATGKRVRG